MKLDGIDHTSTILDCMACVGGNSISFLEYFSKCICVEKDNDKASMLVNNLNNFNRYSDKNIGEYTVINNDILKVLRNEELDIVKYGCDVVFVDPPWGGTTYKYSKKIKIKINELSLVEFITLLQNITRYVVLKLPFNYDMKHLHKSLVKSNEKIGHIINVQDIKNTKDSIKMKIVFIELKSNNNQVNINNNDAEEDDVIDINIGHTLISRGIKTISALQSKHKNKHKNKKTDKCDIISHDLDSGIFNLQDSQASLESVPQNVKIIQLKEYVSPSIQKSNDTIETLIEEEVEPREEHEDYEEDNKCEALSNDSEVKDNSGYNNKKILIIKKM